MTTDSRSTTHTHLHGPSLWLARIAWTVGVLFYLGIFLYALPTYKYYLHLRATLEWGDLLAQAGFSESAYIAYQLGLLIALVVIYTLVAFFLAWRRSDNLLTLALSVAMVAFGVYLNYLSPALLGRTQLSALTPDIISLLLER